MEVCYTQGDVKTIEQQQDEDVYRTGLISVSGSPLREEPEQRAVP